MIKFNKKYEDNITYPISLREYLIKLCEQVGLELGSNKLINENYEIQGNPFTNGEDCKTVLSAVAQLCGGFAKIGRDNKVYIVNINTNGYINNEEIDEIIIGEDEQPDTFESSEIIDGNTYMKFSKNNEYGEVNSLILRLSQIEGENDTVQDDESIVINGLTEITIEDNPFLINSEERKKVIAELWNVFKELKYLPFKISEYYGFPYLDVGDKIEILDTEDNKYTSFIFNHSFTYNGSFKGSIETNALTKTQTAYKNTNNVRNKFRQVEYKVDKINGEISSIIEQQTEQENKLTEAIQDAQKFKYSVTNSGGNNLIKNSVGWADLDFWETDNKELFDSEFRQGNYAGTATDIRIFAKNPIQLNANTSYLFETNLDTTKFRWGLNLSDSGFPTNTLGWDSGWKQIHEMKITPGNNTYLGIVISKLDDSAITINEVKDYDFSVIEVPNIITNKSDEIVKNSLSKSAFQLNNGIMKQSFEVELNKSYSAGFKIKKPTVGSSYVQIIGDSVLHVFNFETGTEIDYQSYDYTFTANTQVITVEVYSDCGMIITDLIANTGDILSQWQPYAQELYALGVQIDSNGIKTYDNISEQEVEMSPTGLIGKYKKEEVFKLNKDVTETKKVSAEEEIDMKPIKIIAVEDGWDFVYVD